MHSSIRARGRLTARAAAVVLGTTVLLAGGLPGLQGEAEAAPQRCMDRYGTTPTPPPRASLPGWKPAGPGQWSTPNAERILYPYEHLSKGFDGLADPSVVGLPQGNDPKKYPWGSIENAAATWKEKQAGPKPYAGGFNEWLNNVYIRNEGNNKRGEGFERQVVRHFNLGGVDWICQGSLKELDPRLYRELKAELGNNFPRSTRNFDAINMRTKTIYEIKSGIGFDAKQLPVDKALVQRGWRVVYINGQEPDANTIRKYNDAGIKYYRHSATPDPQFKQTTYMRKVADGMNPDPRRPAVGSGVDMTQRSAPNPETHRRQVERARGLVQNPAQNIRGPGGVDFSTLDLSYIGQTKSGNLHYAYSARNTDEEENPGYGGKAKARLISDAFYTWLALTPDHFWVNLNPDDPGTIMKAPFDRTDAGRILLEADMEMKREFGRAQDPGTEAGRTFWYGISRVDGAPCMNSTRNWIVPKQAQVRLQDDGVYILDSPLEVKTVAQDYGTPGGGGAKCDLTKEQIAHNMRVYQDTIVPVVEKKINEDARYADLRRVYKARIGAEYVRQTVTKDPTAFGGSFNRIIDSDDVRRWPLRGENASWDKMTVWREMRRSFTEGDYEYELPLGDKVYIYTTGGVDFSKQPQRNIPRTTFTARKPNLDDVTRHVKSEALSYKENGLTFLGGDTSGKAGATNPTPTPTPTAPTPSPTKSDPPKPTDTPSTPAPSTTPPGPAPTRDPQDPDGDLADTGSSAPVGLITGIAAALAAAGAALVWWKRRRPSGG
ncbi:hypothetical protein [Streptomyces sp. Qhu_M48]|uniref:hypothetical protein n=1 Tax=Streptomyces sp. Qhu_M48 TaxID=3435889 RepID=UPI003F501DED